MADTGHWRTIGSFDPSEWFGFIYRIIDLDNGREYIGKKQFEKVRRKKVTGKTRRKVVRSDSDWRTYTSSSKHVNEAIDTKGIDNFVFLIESLHKTKAGLFYAEIEAQVNEDVLRAKLPSGDRKYYNAMVGNVKFLPPEEVSEETRYRISTTLRLFWQNTDHHYYNQMTDEEKSEWDALYRLGNRNSTKRNKSDEEYQDFVKENFSGENNPMHGVKGPDHPRYGKKHTDETKALISEKMTGKMSGENNPRYGKSPHEYMTDDELESLRRNLSVRMSGKSNPMWGKPCTYKMDEEQKEAWKENISKATKGKPKSNETREKMSKPKGPQETVQCPHCMKEGGRSNLSRYHFDNCKLKTA